MPSRPATCKDTATDGSAVSRLAPGHARDGIATSRVASLTVDPPTASATVSEGMTALSLLTSRRSARTSTRGAAGAASSIARLAR